MIKILNHGHVRLVDSMGSDLSVVRSARVSYDAEWRSGEDEGKDAKLINYLVKNGHTSPLEAVTFTFDIKAPIFVLRQWHRHRTWCLDGDTEISFELPTRLRSGMHTAKTMKLADLCRKWNTDAPVKRKDKQTRSLMEFQRERISSMLLRVYDEQAQEFTTGKIIDVISSGVKQLFKVTLANGKKVTCSKDHRLLTSDGWKRLEECEKGTELLCNGTYHTAEGIEAIRAARSGAKSNFWQGGVTPERANIGRWTREQAPNVHKKFDYICQHCHVRGGKLHAHHIKAVVTNPELGREFDNLTSLCVRCHHIAHGRTGDAAMARGKGIKLMARPSAIKSIKPDGERETFDLSVEGPNHNFVANGIVVHNSYNEVSARYTELPEEFYVPQTSQIGVQSKSNKQMRDILDAAEDIVDFVPTPRDTDAANLIKASCEAAFRNYKVLIAAEVPRELARGVLPLNTYSHMFATVDLMNLAKFIKLRHHEHAQYEIRVYAQAMLDLVEPLAPVTVAAIKEHWL